MRQNDNVKLSKIVSMCVYTSGHGQLGSEVNSEDNVAPILTAERERRRRILTD